MTCRNVPNKMARMTLEDLGPKIRRARQRHRWTQAEAARRLGVSVRTIGDWERGAKTPRNLTVVEDVLGITLDSDVPPPDPREEELRSFSESQGGVLPDAEVKEWIDRYRAQRDKQRAG